MNRSPLARQPLLPARPGCGVSSKAVIVPRTNRGWTISNRAEGRQSAFSDRDNPSHPPIAVPGT